MVLYPLSCFLPSSELETVSVAFLFPSIDFPDRNSDTFSLICDVAIGHLQSCQSTTRSLNYVVTKPNFQAKIYFGRLAIRTYVETRDDLVKKRHLLRPTLHIPLPEFANFDI